jgi:hypothetical protein
MGFQEPWQLLQAQGNQAFRQQEFWGLLSRHELQEGSVVVLQAWGEPSLLSAGVLGLISLTGFGECSSMSLLEAQHQRTKPASSGNSGA